MLQNIFDRRDKKLEWLSEGDKIWLGKAAGDLHMCLQLVPIVHLLLGLLKPNLSLPTPQNQGNVLLVEFIPSLCLNYFQRTINVFYIVM